MAVIVVEFLEVVDVDQDQTQRLAGSRGAAHLSRQVILEEAVVVQLGQIIGDRKLMEDFVDALQLGVLTDKF